MSGCQISASKTGKLYNRKKYRDGKVRCLSVFLRVQRRHVAPLFRKSAILRVKPISQLRFDYDATTIRLRREIDVHFLLASNWKQARAIRRSRIVVVS